MSELPADFVAVDPAVAASELDHVLAVLADGLDHPEVWRALAEVAVGPHADALIVALNHVPVAESDGSAKAVEIIAAILVAARGDRATGVQLLKSLEARHSMCTQVAGASFFVARLGDAERTSDLSARFCPWPFQKFETLIDGTVAPCCSIWTQQRYGQLEQQTFEEIWNSKQAIEMRESILDGSFRHCNKQRCYFILEDTLPLRDEVDHPVLRRIIDNEQTVLDTNPSYLYFAHDVTCNLACPSCRSGMLGADEVQKARFAKIEQDVFKPILDAGGDLEVSLSGQGDPWSSQHYRSVLRYIADNDLDIKLQIHTNALLMTDARWDEYIGLEKYRPLVNVSIDACKPWTYAVVRRPGKWEKLEPNLRFIGAKRRAGALCFYSLNATIQLDNFHEMAAIIDFAEEIGVDEVRYYMMQNTGGHLSATFAGKNIADPQHPLHLAFLETLRDPKLARPVVHLYDVANWRTIAFETRLPSDALGADFSLDDLCAAISAAVEADELALVAALCAAGRVRWPQRTDLLLTDALALECLGYPLQASYRRNEAAAIEDLLAVA